MTDFSATRARFHIPEGVVYLDGNSLGPLPVGAAARAAEVISAEWGEMLIRAWNQAGWMDQPRRIGDRIAGLIGAAPGTVVLGDTLSVKVYQALASAIEMRPERRVVLSDSGNFPSDLYIADGLIRSLGRGLELKVVEPEAVAEAIDDSVAAVMLTEVDYRTGRLHDMAALTETTHAAGRDLDLGPRPFRRRAAGGSHWGGGRLRGRLHLQVPQRRPRRAGLHLCPAGPHRDRASGAVRLARPRRPLRLRPRLSSPSRHRAHARRHAPRRADGDPRRRAGCLRRRRHVGAPGPIDRTVRALHRRRGAVLRGRRAGQPPRSRPARLAGLLPPPRGLCRDAGADPRGRDRRFRAPDIIRFGLTPLYIGEAEVDRAADILSRILAEKRYALPEFQRRAAVT